MTDQHPQQEYIITEDQLSVLTDPHRGYSEYRSELKKIRSRPYTPAAPATEPEPKCDDCRFVKNCPLLYFPPCEQLARNDERHYREKAKAEREQVLPIFISKAYTRIETVAPMDGIHKGWVLLADVKECLDLLRGGGAP